MLSSRGSLYNSIVWANEPEQISAERSTFVVSYCDVEDSWDGIGNFSRDPLLADPAHGDFTPRITSPCINAGDPQGLRDPDFSRADVGAVSFRSRVCALSTAATAGDTARIAIHADALPATTVELAFLLDTSAVSAVGVAESAFAGHGDTSRRCWMNGDTVRVRLRAQRPTRIENGPLAVIRP